MRIENLRTENDGDRRRVAANIRWEDNPRPAQTLYFETTSAFAPELEPSPEAFLTAALPAAVWEGERRVRVEGSVCPRLRDGLESAMAVFTLWYSRCRPLAIEPSDGFVPTRPHPQADTASFMSGGVDALALLRANRLDYPLDHPASIRSCLLLFGLNSYDFAASGPRPERLAAFEAQVQRLRQLAERARFTLVPLHTNTRTLYADFDAWAAVGFGAGTICTALAMPGRIRSVWLASAGRGIGRSAHGSHPLLDHHYSTAAVDVHHGQPAVTRLEKTRIVAEWEEARPFLKSCLYQELPAGGAINCERCEKCVRTMLALVALGRLGQVSAFARNDITPEMLTVVRLRTPLDLSYYAECLAPLKRRNREDLARPLEAAIAAYERRQRWEGGGWRRWVRRLDARFLDGRITGELP